MTWTEYYTAFSASDKAGDSTIFIEFMLKAIADVLAINDYRTFKRNIEPLIVKGYIEMTVPDKPNSKLQRYRLTDKGNEIIQRFESKDD